MKNLKNKTVKNKKQKDELLCEYSGLSSPKAYATKTRFPKLKKLIQSLKIRLSVFLLRNNLK